VSLNNAGIPIRDLIIRSPSNASFVLVAINRFRAPEVGLHPPAMQASPIDAVRHRAIRASEHFS
jgi:hypothetical protein